MNNENPEVEKTTPWPLTKEVQSYSENRSRYAPEGFRRLTINLPEALHKKLKLAAIERDCTATDIVERNLIEDLDQSVALSILINAEADLAAAERRLQKEYPTLHLKSLAGLRELIVRTSEKVSQ